MIQIVLHYPPSNHPILVECHYLTHVVSSAAEAEPTGLFINAQNEIPLRRLLQAIGHSQPPTYIKTDNATQQMDTSIIIYI